MAEKRVFHQPDWFRLDNAGILFPGQNTSKWSNIFRVTFELNEEIDPEILKQALINNNNSVIYDILDVNGIEDYIAGYIANPTDVCTD